jgi:phosphotransferase system HPr-like phosphotransfer protein
MKTVIKAGLVAGVVGCSSLFVAAAEQMGATSTDPAQTQAAAAAPTDAAAPAQVIASEVQVTGTVQKISKFRREIQVKAADGSEVSLKVNPEVAQLDSIKKGDNVQVKYLESIALSIQDANAAPPALAAAHAVTVAPAQGSQPATVVNTTAVTATVEQVDAQNRMVTLRDPDGNRLVVKAAPDVQGLDQLKKGDKILAQYTQALAFDVQHV